MTMNSWVRWVSRCFPDHTRVRKAMSGGSGVVLTVPVEVLFPLMLRLRDSSLTLFKVLTDRTAVDYPSRASLGSRFDVVYQLLSLKYGVRCMVRVQVGETTRVPSITSLYRSALWAERECYDMFGIGFEGHPDLRRILTDYGFEGFPLRKDFPLMGFTEVRYDELEKRVVREPIQLSQDLRTYRLGNPWSDATSDGGKMVSVVKAKKK